MKEKVVAIRLTTEEYEMLEYGRIQIGVPDIPARAKTTSAYIRHLVLADIQGFRVIKKKAEAAAKRKAKKAANDTK